MRVVASQVLACVPFGPLSALRYVHMVYTPVIADHFPVYLPRTIGPPWTPEKEAAETVKPFRTRTSRSARIMISSPRTNNEYRSYTSHVAHAAAPR